MTDRLTIRTPDDWHLHLRDDDMMRAVLPASATVFGRALIMPNLVPPVVTAQDARAYRDRILAALPDGSTFQPRMTLYLTETTDPADVRAAATDGVIAAVKLYPAGATTNSASGVTDIDAVMPVLEVMAEIGLPLCVHGEVTDPDIDIFDREMVFLDRVLEPLRQRLPNLRVVMEHITTRQAAEYVANATGDIAATITIQHLMLDRNAMLAGGIRPHFYCLPILKRGVHRPALVAAATSGNPRFFLGTDSAPHLTGDKEAPCGCAGCFTAPVAIERLAEIFDEAGALDKMEAFASLNGARFYGETPAETTLTLLREDGETPPPVETPQGTVTVFDPGWPMKWRIEGNRP